MTYGITRPDYSTAQWCCEDLTRLFDLVVQGKIKPIVAQRIPLIEAAHAHPLLERDVAMGKFVLICNSYK